ncbi:MAG: fibronectin type III domain-containing protein [Armatimonadetes bacterium]|nr:fibronectin type III domain-containing protein [Armatimonadota bacterium]
MCVNGLAANADDAVVLFDDVPFNVDANIPIVNSITVRNAGTSTWSSAGGNYGLSSDSEFGSGIWYPITTDVAPEGSYTFNFTSPAPQAAVKLYHTLWQMKKQGAGVFGTPIVRQRKTTDWTVSYESARLVADDIPIMMGAGEGRMVAITLRNVGTTTWKGSDVPDKYGLLRSDGTFGLVGSGSYLNNGERIAPGDQRTFYIYLAAPMQQGVYMLRLRMIHVTVGSFGPYITRQIEVVEDATPPSKPTVTDDGLYTTNATSFHAAWSGASDSQTGIAEYHYAMGTSPSDTGSGYVVNWTTAGTQTSVTHTGLSLAYGGTYYFYVRARNGAGMWSLVGASNGITVVQQVSRLSEIKDTTVGSGFLILQVPVTAAGSGLVFIQDLDRSCGLKLNWSGVSPSITKKATIAGIYRGIVDNEPAADAFSITAGSAFTAQAVGMSNRSIGWPGSYNGGGVETPPGGAGVDTRCLLIKTWGSVTYAGSGFFLLDDGTGVSDYESTLGRKGIRVLLPTGAPARNEGDRVVVTGISRASADGTRWIMPRSAGDITPW